MADIEALKRQIRDNIRSNGRQDISGDMLQTYMIGILDAFPQNEIKTVTFSELDGLNNSYNTGIYKVSTNGGIVECGKLWVIANWGETATFQVLLSPTTADSLNSMGDASFPIQEGNAMYLCMRYYSKSAGAWSRWEYVKTNLRTANLSQLDNLTEQGSYDLQSGSMMTLGSLLVMFSFMYNVQYATGQLTLNDSGALVLSTDGITRSYVRKKVSTKKEWEAWEEYKPEIDTTPFVKTVEWKGITVKNVNVLQASANVPGEVVLLVNDDNNGISFVYEVMGNGIIPTYYGNWLGREDYQIGIYTPNNIDFTAGFFDKTLYVAPDAIWMRDENDHLVNKTPAPIPDESGFIETTENEIDSLVTPGKHYKYKQTTKSLSTTYDDTCYLSVYQSYYKTTMVGTAVPEYTAIIQERRRCYYSPSMDIFGLEVKVRGGYYVNNASELKWSEWQDANPKTTVVDNLNSTSTTSALSAAQGKALDEKKADKTELSEYAYAPNMPWELVDPNTLGIEQVDDAGNIAIFWKQKDLDGKEKENALNLPVATTALNGIMSTADKSKLDGLPSDAYSKGQTDKRLALKANNADVYTKAQTDAAINSKLVGVYKPQGNKVQFSDLTTADQVAGYVFNILMPFTLDGEEYPAGSNVVWTAEDELRPAHWDVLGGFIDLTPYAKVANLPSKIIEAETVRFTGDAEVVQIVFDEKPVAGGAVEKGWFRTIPMATTTEAGTMSAADKTKLDGMSAKITELEAEIEELKKAIAAK